MKRWILAFSVFLLLAGLGFSCKTNSNPTSANGTPVPGGGGGY